MLKSLLIMETISNVSLVICNYIWMLMNVWIFSYAVVVVVKVFALHSEEGVFESHPQQTLVVKTGSDNSTA